MTGTPLAAVDTAWLHMEDPTNLMMVTGIALMPGQIDIERLRRTLETRLVPIDRFHMRISENRLPVGLPRWEADPNFDLDAHIHHRALPAPGDMNTLQAFVGDLASTPLDFSKPLWHAHVVENVLGGSAMIMRFHHCIGDGAAMNMVMYRLMDTDADAPIGGQQAGEPAEKRGFHPISALLKPAKSAAKLSRKVAGTLIHESMESILHPSHLAELTGTALEATSVLTRSLLMEPDPLTPFKGKLGVQKHVAWSGQVPLDDVKAIGKASGAKVNDVLLAAVSGALRHYILLQNKDMDVLDIRAIIPVDLRPPHRALELGNQFGLVYLSLPLGIADPTERLAELKRRMDAIKNSVQAQTWFLVLNLLGITPQQVEEQLISLLCSKATAVMTNVAGPREKLYMAGSPIDRMVFWVPQSGRLGIGISIMSYDGNVTLGIITDAGLVPDPQSITDRFEVEFQEMLALAQ